MQLANRFLLKIPSNIVNACVIPTEVNKKPNNLHCHLDPERDKWKTLPQNRTVDPGFETNFSAC